MSDKRIALFGGTFDPVHNGHTTVALNAAQRLGVNELVFIPAKQSPLKQNAPHITDDERVSLIRLAIDGESLFTLSTCELTRPAPSYTLDTVLHFKHRYGDNTELIWLIGADAIKELSRWYRIKELLQRCTLTTMVRGGCAHPNFNACIAFFGETTVRKLNENVLETPDVPISSTEIRKRIQAGMDINNLVHAKVADYIKEKRLYHV